MLKGCWALDSKKKILLNIFTGPDLFFHFYDISKQRINVVSVNNIDYAPGYIKKGAIALVFGLELDLRFPGDSSWYILLDTRYNLHLTSFYNLPEPAYNDLKLHQIIISAGIGFRLFRF